MLNFLKKHFFQRTPVSALLQSQLYEAEILLVQHEAAIEQHQLATKEHQVAVEMFRKRIQRLSKAIDELPPEPRPTPSALADATA